MVPVIRLQNLHLRRISCWKNRQQVCRTGRSDRLTWWTLIPLQQLPYLDPPPCLVHSLPLLPVFIVPFSSSRFGSAMVRQWHYVRWRLVGFCVDVVRGFARCGICDALGRHWIQPFGIDVVCVDGVMFWVVWHSHLWDIGMISQHTWFDYIDWFIWFYDSWLIHSWFTWFNKDLAYMLYNFPWFKYSSTLPLNRCAWDLCFWWNDT